MQALALLIGAGFTGLLLVCSLPLGEMGYLGWISLVPLLASTRNKGFVVGFIAAILALFFAAWLSSTGMLYSHKSFTGNQNWLYTGFGLYGFAVALTTAFLADKGAEHKPIWWFAALAVAFESILVLELPAHIALSQYRNSVVLQIASVGGIWLVSFLIWLANLWLARLSFSRMIPFGVALVAVSFFLGLVRFPLSGGSVLVAAIQTSEVDSETLTRLQSEASNKGATFSVWPEFSGIVMAPGGNTAELVELARRQAPFVTTIRDNFEPLPHNVAILFSSNGESKRYFKRKLFGAEKSMHSVGDTPKSALLGETSIGLNICFDSCFPNIMRESAMLEGVSVIALPTIDPESPHHFTAAMHAAYSPFRSAETGVPIVRADGNAYSSITDGFGQVVSELKGGEGVLVGKIPKVPNKPWNRFLKDAWLYACWTAVVVGFVRYRTRKLKTESRT